MSRFSGFAGIVLICFILAGHLGVAQITQVSRYEKEMKFPDELFYIYNLKKEGLVLFRESGDYEQAKSLWEVILLDTDFAVRQELMVPINSRYQLLGYDYVPGEFLLLFRHGNNLRDDLELITISIETGRVEQHEVSPGLEIAYTHFNKVGKNIVLGGKVNDQPTVIIYDPSVNQIKILPGFIQQDLDLLDITVNVNETFNVILMDRVVKEKRKLLFRTFDSNGRILLEDETSIPATVSLQAGISSKLVLDDLMVMGTWGSNNLKQSVGFFSLNINPFRENSIKYYQFGQLRSFLDYLKPRRAERIKEKTRKAIADGRTSDFLSYVMPFELQEYKEQYLMLSEVYTPSSSGQFTNAPYGYPAYNPYWGGYYPTSVYRMYPYQYGYNNQTTTEIKTHSISLTAFNNKGNILWDHCLPVDNLVSDNLRQVGEFYFNGDKTILMYKDKSEIVTKTIYLEDETAEERLPIMTRDPREEIRSNKEYEDGISRWYDNIFYTWGYQTIRGPESRSREVFFIIKMEAN